MGHRPNIGITRRAGYHLRLTMAITLRPLAHGDAAAVAALIRTAFAAQSVLTDPPPSALRVTAADVLAHLAGGGGAIASTDEILAGSALWKEQTGSLYIGRLAVAPGWRRRGIAKALVGAAEAAALGAGLATLSLSTRLVLHDNRKLFAACGFIETTREAHPGYPGPTFVNMEKAVGR